MVHILLAAYNEGAALGRVLEGVARALADGDYRVWVVDDGSRDDTAAVARTWSARIPLTLLRHAVNAGLGKALQTGLSNILPALRPTDSLVTLDADYSHPPELIPRLLRPIESDEADVVIASRFAKGARTVGVPWVRRATSLGARAVFRLFLPMAGVRDYTCGFRAYRATLLQAAAKGGRPLVTESGFAATVEWLARLMAFRPRVTEIPLTLRYDRKPGASKMPVLRTILSTLRLVSRLRRTV